MHELVNRRMQVAVLAGAAMSLVLGLTTAQAFFDSPAEPPSGTRVPATAPPSGTSTTSAPDAATPPSGATPTAAPTPAPAAPPAPEAPPARVGPPVFLTFDDGPDPAITPAVLDLLAAHNAKATFFAQGSQVQAHPELARRIVAEGHSLQNHAWNHPRLPDLSESDIVYGQLQPTNDAITAATGVAPTCLRAPYGATGPTVYNAASSMGLEVVGWHINPADYNNPGAAAIASQVLTNVWAGAIVLLHDAGSGDRQQTVDALATILPELSARGLQPTALCQ